MKDAIWPWRVDHRAFRWKAIEGGNALLSSTAMPIIQFMRRLLEYTQDHGRFSQISYLEAFL